MVYSTAFERPFASMEDWLDSIWTYVLSLFFLLHAEDFEIRGSALQMQLVPLP